MNKWTGRDVTVIIPTYNRVDRIGASIESVQAQTEPVAQIIIVDDGSTDDTASLVQRYAQKDRRIKLVNQKNSGANVARNRGITEATTKLVAFLDSDDQWHADKIERQLLKWQTQPDAVASFTSILAVENGKTLYEYSVPANPCLSDLRCHNALGSTSTAMVRTDVLRSVGGFNSSMPVCQDWDLWLRLRRAGPFSTVTDCLVMFEDGWHERITRGDPMKAINGHRAVFASALSDVVGWRSRARIKAAHAVTLTQLYRRAGRRKAAYGQAMRAMIFNPRPIAARKVLGTLLG